MTKKPCYNKSMKVLQKVRSVFLIFLATLFFASPVLAITQQQLEEFANNNIMFYDPGDVETYNCYSSSAYTVQETDRESFIWNWFVNANIPGVSNNAEVIAGIIGNLHSEVSSYNPFAWGGYHDDGSPRAKGIFKAHNSNFDKAVEDAFRDKLAPANVWDPNPEPDESIVREAIAFELNYMVSSSYNWNGSNFPKLLDIPANKVGEDGAAAYAELFMLVFERPANYASENDVPDEYKISAFYIQDSGVKSYELVYNKNRTTNHLYLFGNSGGQPRRSSYAREVYKKYTNGGSNTLTTQSTAEGSSVSVILDENTLTSTDLLTTTLPSVDIKSLNGITTLSTAISGFSDLRQNIIIYLDLSKDLLAEENLTNTLSSLGSKNVYFVIDTSLENNDSFQTNKALLDKHQSKLQFIATNSQNNLQAPLTALFMKPQVDICNADAKNEDVQPAPVIADDGNEPPQCPEGTIPIYRGSGSAIVDTFRGGSAVTVRLCAVPSVSGTVKLAKNLPSPGNNGKYTTSCNTPSTFTLQDALNNAGLSSTDTADIVISANATGKAVFSSNVASVYDSFGKMISGLLGTSSMPALSSYRSPIFQAVLYQANPDDGSAKCTWLGAWEKAGHAKRSAHVSGRALDLNLDTLIKYYNDGEHPNFTKKVNEVIKNLPGTNNNNDEEYKNYINKTKSSNCYKYAQGSTVSFKNSDGSANRRTTPVVKYLCETMPKYNLYFTVDGEDWHIEAR